MNGSVIDFYYFTGTGNTLRVAMKMAETFRKAGVETNLLRLEKSEAVSINPDHVIGLAFPITVQTASPFIWKFVHALPAAPGTEIFMVDTMMAFSGAVVGPLRRVLRAKSYSTIAAREIIMPNNWYPRKINRRWNNAVIARGMRKAEKYAGDILSGEACWRRVPVLSDGFCKLMLMDSIWKGRAEVGASFRVDLEKCNKCLICEKLCPVENINIDNEKPFDDRCIQCMRCIMFCPATAISRPGKEFERYRAVDLKEIIHS
ncbi:MAG: EFR1 family ferrodoxin [Actinobacteria bacterium]|nr:EFR1 family ferrodoxin [Actinomycetota bacterium]